MGKAWDWKPGLLASRTEGGAYVLTAEGREEFEGRYAANKNPVGIVRKRWPQLYRLARRLVGHEELRAEGWIALWHAIVTYRGGYTLNTWAIHTARSAVQDIVERSVREAAQLQGTEYVPSGLTADGPVHEAEAVAVVRRAVSRLRPAQRNIITSLLDGATVPESAAAAGCSYQNARFLAESAKRRLAAIPKLQRLL